MDKIAFLFSGQGAQSSGMMKDIYDKSVVAQNVFKIADKVLQRPISALCFEGTQEELNLTHNTQPCLLSAELAVLAALNEAGVRPNAVAGFSLGEYAALTAADVFTLEDVFRLIQIRADAMQDACPVGMGGMAAITKQTPETVQALCDEIEGYVVPVNYNCPGQIVISGEAKAVEQACALAKERKIRAIKLPVSVPSHCALMAPAGEVLANALQTVQLRQPNIPCYSDVDALPYEQDADIAVQLCKQVQSPVLWEQLLKNMYQDGIRIFAEVGPGNTLTSFVKKTLEDVKTFSINSAQSLEVCISELG